MVKRISIEEMKSLKKDDKVYFHDFFSNKSEEWKVNGKLKVNGDSFRLPMKCGNKRYAITDGNIQYFSLKKVDK